MSISLTAIHRTPSVKVPVRGFTTAYAADHSYLSTGLAAGINVISDGVSWINGATWTFLGTGPAEATLSKCHGTSQAPTEDTQMASIFTARTLRDQQKGKDPQHFYNGNQLSFKPRRDEDSTDGGI